MQLICYLSHGYPSLEASRKMAHRYVNSGASCIEVDFPSRNPYLENDLIKSRMALALEACADYSAYFQNLLQMKAELTETRFLLLIYEETLLNIGLEHFCSFCLEGGFLDLILVGQKSSCTRRELMRRGLRVSCYVQFHMPEEEVAEALASDGFCYLQAVPRPDQEVKPGYPDLASCIKYLRGRGLEQEIYCGVGVHSPEIARRVREAGADGVFVGSSILELWDQPEELREKITEYCQACTGD